MLILFFLSTMIVFVGVMTYVSNRSHLLSMLLSLEFMVLGLFLGLIIFLGGMGYEMYFSMVFLTFSVCEGALGLSVLVSMIRTHGNDYFNSFSVIQC